MDTPVLVDQQGLTSIKICVDTGCSLEDPPGVMDDRDGWGEEVRELCAFSVTRS